MSIGSAAFGACSGLASITVDEANAAYKGVNGVLMSKDGKTLIAYPAGKTETAYTIPDGITSIGNGAFLGCSVLTSIYIPEGVTSISSYAFSNCIGLSSVTIPCSVTTIAADSFYSCSSMTAITVDESNTSFMSVDGVLMSKDGTTLKTYPAGKTETTYTIPDGVTSIGDLAFAFCSSLTSITIPDGVTSIGDLAFAICSGLKDLSCHAKIVPNTYSSTFGSINIANVTLHVPAELIKDYKAIDPWNQFKEIVAIGETGIVEVDGIYYNFYSEAKIAEVTENPNGYQGDITIPRTFTYGETTYRVTGIGYKAFSNCSSLTSIIIPDGVTSIGSYAFSKCSGLTSITIPEGVTSIYERAFCECSGLTSITILNGVTTIYERAFMYCSSLNSISIPSSVNDIYDDVFLGCTSLTSIAVDETNHFYKSVDGVLMSKDGTRLITYPAGKTATTYTIPEGVTRIYSQAFYGCSHLTSVIIPDDMKSISEFAFQKCSSLKSVSISNSVIFIGEYAFDGCSGLTSITIPDGVTSIGAYAFQNCSGLTSLTIGSGVTEIGENAFDGCNSITSLTIHTPEVGNWFNSGIYNSIQEIVLGEGVTKIAGSAFSGCSGVSITLPSTVTEIGSRAFSCKGLLDLYCYAENVPKTASRPAGGAFASSNYKNATLHVPASAVEAYKATSPWNQFKEIVALPNKVIKGDANNDGKVDAADIVEVLNFLIGNPSENFSETNADANEDGTVNAADIVIIANKIMGIAEHMSRKHA